MGRWDDERRGANSQHPQGAPGEAPLGSGSSDDDDCSDVPSAQREMFRSRSLPQIIPYKDKFDSGMGSFSGADQDVDAESIRINNCQKVVYDLRQMMTLKQHYYPEGGWGWIIVICAFLVQCLSHGFHGASGIIFQQILNRFEDADELEAGMLISN